MVLKGVMTIELTDAATGAVETVTEENMITESVNNILGLNPMGIFYAATGQYDSAVLWNGNLLPICPNMIGGILLFSKALICVERCQFYVQPGKGQPEPDGEHGAGGWV